MDHIKRCARRLVKKYSTRDPETIAKALGFLFVYKELPMNLLGMYLDFACRRVIALNNRLDDSIHRITIVHEIGHYLLHPGYNRRFLIAHTLYNKGKFEREADRFAAEILISDTYSLECECSQLTFEQIAVAECVPMYFVELKFT